MSATPCDESPSPICSNCRSFLIQPTKSFDFDMFDQDDDEITVSMEEFVKSKASGCRICAQAWDTLHSLPDEYQMSEGVPLRFHLRTRRRNDIWGPSCPTSLSQSTVDSMHLLISPSITHNLILIGRLAIRDDDMSVGQITHHRYRHIAESRCSLPINTAPLESNSGAPTRLELIEKWIKDCFENHPQCHQATHEDQPDSFPTRLIHVTSSGQPKLVLTDAITICPMKYATLSHRWRDLYTPKLLQENIEAMKHGIGMESLPLAFRDAINLCKRLQVQYLWIDAICIVQDDDTDCMGEIRKMGAIYANAYCNLSATAAAESPLGLFVERDTTDFTAYPVTIQRQNVTIHCYWYFENIEDVLNNSPLMRRGWVLQERLLSPHSIYFGNQMSWECTEILASELFPEGIPRILTTFDKWGYDRPFKLGCLLNNDLTNERDDTYVDLLGGHDREKYALYTRWAELVEEYTTCNLTFESDILPAISGLAHHFGKSLGDVYLAGLWKGNLLEGLLWEERGDGDCLGTRPRNYRAPSWSWASLKGPILYQVLLKIKKEEKPPKIFVTLLDASTTLAGDDPMGQVTDGYVRLSGYLRPHSGKNRNFLLPYQTYSAPSVDFTRGDVYDTQIPPQDLMQKERYLVPFLSQDLRRGNEDGTDWCIKGLILEPVSSESNTYRRLGLFCHHLGRDPETL
ncbi:heterokaryon incompatibility [Pyrenophora seminiperda CCB06]|uniref:Heterokaryon incompatibility n=1 Tax=Pyrenophora seminiperda CCB06 TaxID=1302712 RepID=A0A3M7MH14_9PLEO|nr:heterokaryon incompatibility [Pyrenophora seminiperda CCB06]